MNRQNQGQANQDFQYNQGKGEMKNPQTDKRATQEYKEQKKEQAEQQPRDDQGRFVSKDNK